MDNDIRNRFRTPNRTNYLGPMPNRPHQQTPKPQPRPMWAGGGKKSPEKQLKLPQQPPKQPPSQPKKDPVDHESFFGGNIPTIKKQPSKTTKKKAKGRSRKLAVISTAIVVVFGLGFGGWSYFGKNDDTKDQQVTQSSNPQTAGASTFLPVTAGQEPQQPGGTITLVATGTFAAYDSINQNAKQGNSYDYRPMMANLKTVFSSADVTFCHQETLAGGSGIGISGYPEFNAPFEWSQALIDTGCNVINMASRNTNDKGQEAISSAVSYFDDKQTVFAAVGANRNQAEQDEIRYFEVKGFKFATLAYTTQSNKPANQGFGVNIYNKDKAIAQLKTAKENADFTIIGMNWGNPDDGNIQPEQESIAQDLASAGADLIIGNGPHVVQTAKVLPGIEDRQALVFYSLGNAVNSQLPIDNLIGALAVVTIDIKSGDMIDPGVLPIYQHYEWTAAQKASANFDARTNFNIYLLDQAADALGKSLNNTTVEAQTQRITDIMTQNVPIKILTSSEL